MKCENCGYQKMEVLERGNQWLCPKCGSLWTKEGDEA